jgi:hypothetical protein
MLVYLDTCAIQRPLDDLTQLRVRVEADALLAIIAAAEAEQIQLISSDVLRFETANNPIPSRRDFGHSVLAIATVDVSSTTAVSERARQYEQLGIKPLDAVHLSSSVEAGAEFFCTVDDTLRQKARSANTGATRVVSALELISELSS